jgi:hypothetical protein
VLLILASINSLGKQFSGQCPAIGSSSLKPAEKWLRNRMSMRMMDESRDSSLTALQRVWYHFGVARRTGVELGWQSVAHNSGGEVFGETVVNETVPGCCVDEQACGVQQACDESFPVRDRDPGVTALLFDPGECPPTEIGFAADCRFGQVGE